MNPFALLKQSSKLPFEYQLTRSKRKTVSVSIRNGKVDVRAPTRAPQYWIDEFLHKKTTWILKQIAAIDQRAQKIEPNQELSYLGKNYRVVFINDLLPSITIGQNQLIFRGADFSQPTIQKLFVAWLHDQAQHYMTPLAQIAAEKLGVANKLNIVRFKITRSTWGYCSAKGLIQFNPLIMMAEHSVIDYLISHEVSHLKHLNHSADFWNTVESLHPNYKVSRKILRSLETTLLQLI